MKVLKFGGSSVGTWQRVNGVIDILIEYLNNGENIAVVFSAFQGVTDTLIEAANEAAAGSKIYKETVGDLKNRHLEAVKNLIKTPGRKPVSSKTNQLLDDLSNILYGVFLVKELTPRTLDYILGFGEYLSNFIITETLKSRGYDCEFLDSRQLIKTDNHFGFAKVQFDVTNKNIKEYFAADKKTQIITGFIASTLENETTTLGRGGSDYTASIFAAALDAEEIEIWTDVDGIMTADPRKVADSFPLKAVTYEEAMEMSHFGAKVIYPPTMLPALQKKIKIRIRNTFNPSFRGTVIIERDARVRFNVKGISSIDKISLLRVEGGGMVGIEGLTARLFNALAHEKINVLLITQGSSGHTICTAVLPEKAEAAKKIIEHEFRLEIHEGQLKRVTVQKDLSIIAVVGEDMENTPGIAGKVFQSLGKNGINTVAIAQGSSELNISLVINYSHLSKALNVLHDALFISKQKVLNLFLVGPGLVGSSLLNLLREREHNLFETYSVKVKLAGIASRSKMVFDKNGIPFNGWKEKLSSSKEKMKAADFVERMKSFNLPNTIFIDTTAGTEIINHYREILEGSISVVTPNKIANSGAYKDYRLLRDTARYSNVQFRYSTNVGAGLPMIDIIGATVTSGDKILKLVGILSGSINFILNKFNDGMKFSEAVKLANEKGYTEPDPGDDLNGVDVARKLLILVREAGIKMELKDIIVKSLLPEEANGINTAAKIFTSLKNNDPKFETLRARLAAEGKRLAYIASYNNGKASVALREISAEHPFSSLSGSENILAITTSTYKNKPLIIRGTGAGADVTAAGIISDIIKISNYLG